MPNKVQITRPKPSNEAERHAEKAAIAAYENAGMHVRVENQAGTVKYETPEKDV